MGAVAEVARRYTRRDCSILIRAGGVKMLPRYLYHATAVCNQEGIEREGLLSAFGEVYASESEND